MLIVIGLSLGNKNALEVELCRQKGDLI